MTVRYGLGTLSSAVSARIEHELAVIRDKGYADYFLVVEEIVGHAPRTCGRGSAAASIVSYCLGITHVDPIRHHLLFERFLNPGRHDPPDIDIDFPWDERDAILDWVFAQYGDGRRQWSPTRTHSAIRAAIRETAKVYGLPADRNRPYLAIMLRKADPPESTSTVTYQQWAAELCRRLRLSLSLAGNPSMGRSNRGAFRNLSLHCGGVVLVPGDIHSYVPVERSAKGMPVIQWEKDQAEEAGLVKIDLLGNRSLAVIRDALAAIAGHTGGQIDYATWDPLSDDRT